jgi:magnesium-transporting ATPase (P-type)
MLGILIVAKIQVLILAMAVSFGIQSWIEGGVVAAVIMLNIVVGFFQEYSAEKTMDSLRSLSSPTATVVRGGEAMVVPSGEVVPGDLIEVKMGDTIPADIRYGSSTRLDSVFSFTVCRHNRCADTSIDGFLQTH